MLDTDLQVLDTAGADEHLRFRFHLQLNLVYGGIAVLCTIKGRPISYLNFIGSPN